MGRAGAREFAAQGAHVIAVDVNPAGVKAIVEEINGKGGSAEAHVADLGDQQALDEFLNAVTSSHEVLDVLYNHVGVTGPVGLDYDLAGWIQAMTVNTWVPMYTTKQLLPLLRKSAAASIIYT